MVDDAALCGARPWTAVRRRQHQGPTEPSTSGGLGRPASCQTDAADGLESDEGANGGGRALQDRTARCAAITPWRRRPVTNHQMVYPSF